MPFHFNGSEVLTPAEFALATDIPERLLVEVRPTVEAPTVEALLSAFDRCRDQAFKHAGPEERDGAHPAIRAFMVDSFRDRAAVFSALADEEYTPGGPLTEDQERALLGPGLWPLRSKLFAGARAGFYRPEDIEAVREARERELVELRAQARSQALSRARRESNGPGALSPEDRAAAERRAVARDGDVSDPFPVAFATR